MKITHGVTRSIRHQLSRRCFSSRQVSSEFLDHEIGLLTLNRPPANAMGRIFLQQFQEELEALQSARCVVVHSALAPKVFSAGADLKERATMTLDQAQAFVTDLRRTMEALHRLPMPVIAALDGVAVGGGLELALASDLRVVSASSRLGFPETSLAIVPGAGGTQRLPRLVGVGRANELIWTGRRVSGLEAGAMGLAERVVDNTVESSSPQGNATLEQALELAQEIAVNGPVAIRAAKWAVHEGMKESTMESALEIERQAYARVLGTRDRLEGLAAFKEGRKPSYKGE